MDHVWLPDDAEGEEEDDPAMAGIDFTLPPGLHDDHPLVQLARGLHAAGLLGGGCSWALPGLSLLCPGC